MSDYVLPILFLVVVFVVFALANRNRYKSCADCTGDCDKSSCDNRDGVG